jgi:hypothetical protein
MAASNLKLKPREMYGILTPDFIRGLTERRLLGADLLSYSRNLETRHAAVMVRNTVEAIRDELWSIMLCE